jgi:hypothetical protein
MSKEEIVEMIIYLYEIDIDNCILKPIDFANEIAEALTNKDYLKELIEEYKQYKSLRDEQ